MSDDASNATKWLLLWFHRWIAMARVIFPNEDRDMSEAREPEGTAVPHGSEQVVAEEVQAWELIDTGRYMPRRIRGSYRGRALG